MTDAFEAKLRSELVDAAGRRNRQIQRRRRVIVVTVAALAVVVAATAFSIGLTRPKPASAGVDVKVQNGELTVRLTDLESRPEVIRSALAAAGLRVTISAVPVGPSNVGRFVSTFATATPPELRTVDASGSSFAGFVLPVGWPGELDLMVGRPAATGESYVKPSDAFAAHEPLACSKVLGAALADVARLGPAGVSVRVQLFEPDGTTGPPLPLADALATHGTYRVAAAEAFSPTDVKLDASSDGKRVAGIPETAVPTC